MRRDYLESFNDPVRNTLDPGHDVVGLSLRRRLRVPRDSLDAFDSLVYLERKKEKTWTGIKQLQHLSAEQDDPCPAGEPARNVDRNS